MAGKPDATTLEYLPKIKAKPLFLFATHGTAAGSNHAKEAMEIAKGLAPDADIKGTFSCQGEANPKVLEKIKSKQPLRSLFEQSVLIYLDSIIIILMKKLKVTEKQMWQRHK